MLAKLGSFITAVAFPLLCLYCISSDGQQIADLLRGGLTASLKSANINDVDVKADGRDITLTGKAPSEEIKTKAGQLALAMPGVRTIDNQLVVGADVKAIQTQLDKILLDKNIEFETSKNVILPVSTPILEEVLGVLNKAPELSADIFGHTDNQGDPASNRALSQSRAQAVAAWMTQRGIASNRLRSNGFGPDKPIAPNTTPEGRAKNRRVEIIAH